MGLTRRSRYDSISHSIRYRLWRCRPIEPTRNAMSPSCDGGTNILIRRFFRARVGEYVSTTFNPHFDLRVDPKAFEAVRSISLDFLDGKLVTLWIGFEETYKWPKLDEFVNGFATALNLPLQWPVRRMARELMCDRFSVQAL